jgi:prophage regulatory protein
MADNFVRLGEVKKRTGLSTPTIYRKMANGEFPAQFKLGDRAVGWRLSEIEAWMESRVRSRHLEVEHV